MADRGRDLTHYYHANASGWGGQLDEPNKMTLPVLAATALPTVGGYATATHEDFGVDLGPGEDGESRSITIKRAFTEVLGELDAVDESFHTVVRAEIEGLNILNILLADKITMRIDTYHPPVSAPPGDTSFTGYYPTVTFTNLLYDGLSAYGIALTPVVNKLEFFDSWQKPNYPVKPWPQDQALRQFALNQSQGLVAGVKGAGSAVGNIPVFQRLHNRHNTQSGPNSQDKIDNRGNVVISVVDGIKIDGESDKIKTVGHVLFVEDLGRFFFGELIVDGNAFNLNMLRTDMGSAAPGRGSGPGGTANGTTTGGG